MDVGCSAGRAFFLAPPRISLLVLLPHAFSARDILVLSYSRPHSPAMAEKVLNDISHRRYNPLTGGWLLVSPHRTKRPWQ
ncbi:hypothetical protein QBC33DRAFT_536322 [Phialemonium atrogriseum]|uniref:Galactose-1-phosphate uridyl transferase N-terminal domain-containing protein n=1 Tax=Phialemonium atrogriseum TaxID=1093897 RepID=A0AAJ0C5N6_9PEZI|nr:uncharacterized protein QBC33DRAFT_536322 [Phialemonium atrogriseum]KAK1768126.1 hypothetical protein QBC33DRAFT_536322 [Phialemonium atrogriseum]